MVRLFLPNIFIQTSLLKAKMAQKELGEENGHFFSQKELENEPDEKPSKFWTPIKIILAVFLIFLMVLWIIPSYGIKSDPGPARIPTVDEVIPPFPAGNMLGNETFSSIKLDYQSLIIPSNPYVKYTADKIISASKCPYNKVCFAKAMFYFVRDNFDYVNDPNAFEFIKDPVTSLQTRAGDCDDSSVLLANLLEAVGIETRFAFIPGHVFLQADLPEAKKKYKTELNWVSLDPTCDYCGFGEIPWSSYQKEFSYFP